jgi:hypothetical protein
MVLPHGAGRLDVIVGLGEVELGVGELRLHGGEPLQQVLAAFDDNPGLAAQHLRLAARQVELAAADVHPHVVVHHHQIRIAGEAEPGAIEQRGDALVGNGDIDVLEVDGVAEILGGAVEGLLVHGPIPERFDGRSIAWGGCVVEGFTPRQPCYAQADKV